MIQAISRTTRFAQMVAGISVTTLVMLAAPVSAQPPERSGYTVAWHDEFNGGALDTSLWTPSNNQNTTNNSQQDYLPSQVSVGNGNMSILAENLPSRGRPYRSGLVTSTALQKHGRWDVRAKLPTSTGMWPAIWLLSDAPWPSEGEIDIMENRGTQPNLTSSAFHYGTNGNGQPYRHDFVYAEQTSVHDGVDQNYHNDFHTYSVEWDPDQIRFFVDDVHHWTVRDSDVDGFLTNQVGEMRLIINNAIGGTFLDNPDASTVWPQTFEVDYVHAYEKSAEAPTLTFENGGFETGGGSLGHWTKFGNSINNVSSGNERIAEGDEAIKLYGQFNGATNYSGVEQGISVNAGDELTAIAKAFIAPNDSIAGSTNQAFLKIDYYNKQWGQFGTEEYLSSDSILLADGLTANDQWLTHELTSTVPAGAVEARLAVVFAQQDNAGGAVFVDDIQFSIDSPILIGDFDLDGDVDTDDIDFYAGKIGDQASVDPRLDLNNDGQITLADHDLLVTQHVQVGQSSGAIIGDMDLNGEVDILGDAATLVNFLNATSNVGYAQGDLNADGRVDVLGDATRLVANLNGTASASSASTAAVPEPTALLLFAAAALFQCFRR